MHSASYRPRDLPLFTWISSHRKSDLRAAESIRFTSRRKELIDLRMKHIINKCLLTVFSYCLRVILLHLSLQRKNLASLQSQTQRVSAVLIQGTHHYYLCMHFWLSTLFSTVPLTNSCFYFKHLFQNRNQLNIHFKLTQLDSSACKQD